jgi:hypothetical protein
VKSSKQVVRILSSPDNAKIVIYDKYNVKVFESSTPATAKLKRASGYFSGAVYYVEISQAGYETQRVELSPELNLGWYAVGNIILGGLLGILIIDPITGGMWTLTPEAVNYNLQKKLALNNENFDGIYIVLKEQIPNDIFENLDLVQIK